MEERVRSRRTSIIAGVWGAAVIGVTVQLLLADRINNLRSFRAASWNLLRHQDLYAAYPGLHLDFYKYSPTFAVLFLPFAAMPVWLSLLMWNLVGAGALYLALGAVLPRRQADVARAIAFLDMVGSLQTSQSNALVTALILWAFASYEREKSGRAGLAAAIGTSVKIFPLSAATFALFHPGRVRAALKMAAAAVVLLLLPLLVTSPTTLLAQYESWRAIEAKDALDRGFTVMQMLHLSLGVDWPNWPVQLAGVIALVAPILVRRDRWTDSRFRRLYLCSVLVFCIIFNHQSESSTFVIASTGVAIWFAQLEHRSRWDWVLLVLLVFGTMLASTSLMPGPLRRDLFGPYRFKTVPLVIFWIHLQWLLWNPSIGPARSQVLPFRRLLPASGRRRSRGLVPQLDRQPES